jgi:hypothetical protein
MPEVSHSSREAVRTFSFWVANRTMGADVLAGLNYASVFREPGALATAYAIFANTVELDDAGNVQNGTCAERRAAQYIRQYVTGISADPPIEEWECEPSPLRGILPWPDGSP